MIAKHTLDILEFPKIRHQLAQHTSFTASRELALALVPDTDVAAVRYALDATSAARDLFDAAPDITIGGARDVRPAVWLSQRGGVLETTTLLDVAATLRSMRQLRTRLLKLPEDPYAPLLDLANILPDLSYIESDIERAIDPGGEVLDSASPTLGRLRGEIRIAHDRLMERLNGILQSSQYAPVLQEPIVTIRDGRYVVPIKASGRRTLRGVVHDQSNSGATLFVEPLQTVELNNRWRELQIAEQQEIQRILQALSAQIADSGEQIVRGVEALAHLDLLFAKARYSVALNAMAPKIVETTTPTAEGEPPVFLRRARHPLINQRSVVPIDVWLGGDFRVLLITGPNTGGKTVALKTTGLLALMAQAGLEIPVADRSRLPVFTHIFADIGDEQSIEQSLSTFSSHMTNIISILQALDTMSIDERATTLVLFDELGAGTDPTEGAALARAIVEYLLDRSTLCIATTHYAELKVFAHNAPGVTNASVAFDQETLRPTYRLEIGLPGRSNALAIASRLGLQSAVLDRARSFLSSETEQVEDLLRSIAEEREAARQELLTATSERDAAAHERTALQEERAAFERERDQRLESFERELEQELRDVRQDLRRLREDTRSVSLTREWLQQAEERLKTTNQALDQRRQQRRQRQAAAPAQQVPRPIQPGDRVRVQSVNLDGEVLDIDQESQQADVQVGGFRMTVDLHELQRIKGSSKSTPPPAAPVVTSAPRNVSMQLDMRGMRAGDVIELLDRYLNDAYLANLNQVRLIHGKGTGALRNVVRDVLSSHPLVEKHTSGVQGEGGDGVTVAQLRRR